MSGTEVLSEPMVGAEDGRDPGARPTSAPPRSRAGRRLVRALAVAVAVVAIVAVVVGAVLFDMEPDILVYSGTVLVRELVPGVVAFAVVGAVVLRRPTATAVGWTMLAMAWCWGLAALSMGLWSVSFVVGWGTVAHLWVAYTTFSNLGWMLGMIVLPQVFPTGWLSGWVWRGLLIVPLLGYAAFLVVGGWSSGRPTSWRIRRRSLLRPTCSSGLSSGTWRRLSSWSSWSSASGAARTWCVNRSLHWPSCG